MMLPSAGRRLQIKICGITNPEDANAAIDLGADALGFNFYPRSPRALAFERDASWIRELPASVWKVAVTVNASFEEVARLFVDGIADWVQLHGEEDAAYCATLSQAGIPFVKAIRVRDAESLTRVEQFGAHLLLDAYRPDAFGGTGHRLDWELARRFVDDHAGRFSVILSGGLNPDNISAAILQTRPAGVDVASGVEKTGEPRRKDHTLMREFIANARSAESLLGS